MTKLYEVLAFKIAAPWLSCALLERGAVLLGQLEGCTLGAGAVLGSGTAGAHLDGVQGANALGTVVVGTAGDTALDAVVGIHITVHGKYPPFENLQIVWVVPKDFIHPRHNTLFFS